VCELRATKCAGKHHLSSFSLLCVSKHQRFTQLPWLYASRINCNVYESPKLVGERKNRILVTDPIGFLNWVFSFYN
jgi:hypothetical protein